MSPPDLVPIAHEPEYHTSTIGRYSAGQFYAAVHGAHRDNDDTPDWGRERIRWYAYLHLFDDDGRHVRSDITLIGIAPNLRGELGEQATARLTALLDPLPGRHLGDIAIRSFRLQHDGVTFGLIDESDAERGDWMELYPDRLGFAAPWNGSYST
jgi:formate hydrogenlyase regulatory protein HycA